MCIKNNFDFEKEVKKHYGKCKKVYEKKLSAIYNCNNDKKVGKSTEETSIKGVYALYLDGQLMKIGRAITGSGIFTRMSQYYRLSNEGSKYITEKNRDLIEVKYFELTDNKECWAGEKRLQVIAFDCGEKMPWDDEVEKDH